jgi:hypothetical protein
MMRKLSWKETALVLYACNSLIKIKNKNTTRHQLQNPTGTLNKQKQN